MNNLPVYSVITKEKNIRKVKKILKNYGDVDFVRYVNKIYTSYPIALLEDSVVQSIKEANEQGNFEVVLERFFVKSTEGSRVLVIPVDKEISSELELFEIEECIQEKLEVFIRYGIISQQSYKTFVSNNDEEEIFHWFLKFNNFISIPTVALIRLLLDGTYWPINMFSDSDDINSGIIPFYCYWYEGISFDNEDVIETSKLEDLKNTSSPILIRVHTKKFIDSMEEKQYE
ncbi:MAG: hypothetical protein QXV60_01640 [Nitrososphaerota archaeon]